MRGEFSLSDAVRELKACKSQLAQRDKQLVELTATANQLHVHAYDVTHENEQLR